MDTPVESDDITGEGPQRPEPQTSTSPLRVIGTAVFLAAAALLAPLVVFGLIAAVVIVVVDPSLGSLARTAALVLGTVAQFSWFVVVGLWYLRRRGFGWKQIRSYIGIERPSLRDGALILGTWVVMIVAIAVTAAVVTTVLFELVGTGAEDQAENQSLEFIDNGPSPLVIVGVILGMFLVVGPAEETLFRGVIQGRLRERFSAAPAIALASAIFASAHVLALVGSPTAVAAAVVVLFVPSLAFGILYEYTGNLIVPVLLHGFHNSMIVLGVYASAIAGSETTLVLGVGALTGAGL